MVADLKRGQLRQPKLKICATGKQLTKWGGQGAQPCGNNECVLSLVVQSFQARGNDMFPFGCFWKETSTYGELTEYQQCHFRATSAMPPAK
jgi:hypothetical protein